MLGFLFAYVYRSCSVYWQYLFACEVIKDALIYVCRYVMGMSMYVYMYVYIYIYIYVYAHEIAGSL